MKIIKVFFLSLLALSLIACTGIFILFQTFDTDQYLPQITNKASAALGRQVYIGHLALGLSMRGITLDAGPVTVADDAAFSAQPFIKIDMVRISLDLSSLILRREVRVSGILLQSPQIHFIRSMEGNVNAQSIAPKSRSAAEVSLSAGDELAPVGEVAGTSSGVIARSTVGHSDVTRQFFKNGVSVNSVQIQDAAICFIDQSPAMPLDIWLTDINASLNGFSLSNPFRLAFDASLYSDVPNVHVNTLVSLDLPKRSVQFSALSLHTDLTHLDVDRIKGISPEMSDFPVAKGITGVMQLNLAHLGVGTPGDFTANGDVLITDGVIKNFNIVKTLLSHTLMVFGGMDSNINNLLNGQLKSTLGADDTILDKATAQFSFHDKTIFIDDSLIKTNIFELTAKGSVQALNTDMQTMLHLNQDVSAALVNEFGGLKLLCDDSNRIAIGASLEGVIPHLKYKPNKDFRKKSKKALMQEGGNILGALLGGR